MKKLIIKLIVVLAAAILLFFIFRQKPGTNDPAATSGTASAPNTPAGTTPASPAAKPSTDEALLKAASHSPGINAGTGKFDINTPAGWQRKDTIFGGISAVMLSTPSSDPTFRTNINVVSDSMQNLSIDDYEQQTILNLAKYVRQFVLTGKGEVVIGGIPARWIQYSQRPIGFDLSNICYLVPNKGIVYIITCSSLQSQMEQNRPPFDQAVLSFRLRH